MIPAGQSCTVILNHVADLPLGGWGEVTLHVWRLGEKGPFVMLVSEAEPHDPFPARIMRPATVRELIAAEPQLALLS